MNYLVSIEHPAWAHQFQMIIKSLISNGHAVKIVLIEKDNNEYLIQQYGLQYDKVGRGTGTSAVHKLKLLFVYTLRYYLIARKFKPDCLFGRASPMMSLCAFLLWKPHCIFEDTDHSYISLFFAQLFTKKIYTNSSFLLELGKKQVRLPTCKELFYLHPDIFTPDKGVLKSLDIMIGEMFTIVRFVSWSADHDLGHQGFSDTEKIQIVNKLSNYGKVFISSEKKLPDELKQYEFKLSPEKMHSLLSYAHFIFSESATMAAEAAVLGTYAIYCDFKGRGYTSEMETKYGLVFNFDFSEKGKADAMKKAIILASDKKAKDNAHIKRDVLLSEKKNGSELFLKELVSFHEKNN